jgi:ribosomal protein L40E
MVIDHSAADLGHLLDTAVCVSCHAANDPMAVHANDCSSCHTAPPALRDPSERPPVTDISRGECSNCHTTYFNDHNHDHSLEVLANSASTPATVNCISCHTATTAPFVGGGEAHAASGCATCHDTATDGALKSPAVAGGGECVTCHTSLFDSHDHGSTGGNVDHTVVMGVSDLGQATSQYCSDCHAVLSWTNILTTHSSDCITCHNATRDINPATPTGTTVQDVINNANQSTVNCLDCHDDKAAPAVHLSADHSAAGLGHLLDTAMCVSCHAANDPMTVHSNNCSSCHTAPPNLRDPSERVLVTNISRGECSNCHTTYFNDHNHDHAATVTATSLCTSCHTGDVVALHNDCSSCHSSSDGSRIVGVNGYGDATVNGGAGGTCQDCHAAYYDAHTHDHSLDVSVNSASIPATVNCTYCHTATSAPFVGGGEVHESSGCATCHDTATDGGLKSPAVGGGGECVTCHTTLFDAHDHGSTGGNVDHTVVQGASDLGQATSQPCSDCHAVLSWTNILTTHSSDCITCHNATRDINPAAPTGTTVQDVITNANQSTVNCLDCHMDKAAPAVHLTADHSASGLGHLLDTAMCVSCHSANDPMAVHSSKCSNCHTTPPTLRDPSERVLVTDISRGACSDCHTTYFDDHLHDHAATVTATSLCTSCHTGDTGDTVTLHNDCNSCHSSSDNSLIVGVNGYGDATVNGGTGGTCQECHAAYYDAHIHDHSLVVLANSASVPATVNCISCHTTTTPPFVGGGEAHAANGCATCHDTATDGGLKSPAVVGGGECVTCHTSLFDAHDHGSTGGNVDHTVVMGAGDLGQAGSQPCSDCHAVLSWTNILTTHSSDCVTCHNATRDINPAAPVGTTVQDVITNANQSTVNCLDCHLDKAAPAVHLTADHSATGLAHLLDTAVCVSCHAVSDPMAVHSNNCSSCHTAPPTLRDPAERPLANSISRGECTECHTTYSADHNGSPPLIAVSTPADNATGVANIANLQIEFDKAVYAQSGNIILYKIVGDVLVESFDVTSAISGNGSTTISLNPAADLESLIDYYVQIDATAFDDNAGNSFAGISDKMTWNFTSADATLPTLVATIPVDNSIAIGANDDLVMNFTENMFSNAGNIVIYRSSDDSVFETIDITGGQVSIVANSVTVNPAGPFASATAYYIQIDNGAFEDASTNSWAGLSDKVSWNFTAADTDKPGVVISSTEGDPTINSPFSVTITFDEAVSGFVLGDIGVGNGTAGNLANTVANTTWTVEIVPIFEGVVTVDVNSSVAIDAAGNNNDAASQYSITYAPVDSDGDGLPDNYETAIGTDIGNNPTDDYDVDGFTDRHEYLLGLNPLVSNITDPDNDGDGISDLIEDMNGLDSTDPTDACADPDDDGIASNIELANGTSPVIDNALLADSDNDGIPDLTEWLAGLNPLVANSATDSDSDGLNDLLEYKYGTLITPNAFVVHSDSDGLPDFWEICLGLNPNDPDSDNDTSPDNIDIFPMDDTKICTGDINMNGTVEVVDAMLALRMSVGLVPENLLYGDVAPMLGGLPNPDTQINAADAMLILRKALGLVNW